MGDLIFTLFFNFIFPFMSDRLVMKFFSFVGGNGFCFLLDCKALVVTLYRI